MVQTYTLAVVGGGSISTSLLAQLSRLPVTGKSLRILQFEPSDVLGVGQPYQSDLDSVLLNTPARALSILADEPGHFLDWLQHRGMLDAAYLRFSHESVPRRVYGEYLAATYSHHVERLRSLCVDVTVIRDRVADIERRSDGRLTLIAGNARCFVVDEAVLCIGNLPASELREFIGMPAYFHSAYPCREVVNEVRDAASVGIVGTSLSAVDVIASLHDFGYQGQVTAFSRRGYLPSVRSPRNSDFNLRWFTRENIDAIAVSQQGKLRLRDLVSLLCKDIDERAGCRLSLQDILGTGTHPIEHFESEIRLARQGERHWQSVLYRANDIVDYAWSRLAPADRKMFDDQYRHIFMSRRIAIPLVNAQKFLAMLKSGRLSVKSMVTNVSTRSGGFEITFAPESGSPSIQVERLINATGMCVDLSRSDDPLIRNLLARGIAVQSEFGGVRQDFESLRLLSAENSLSTAISLLGSLGVGTFFWTNAMSVNARLAGKLAQGIAESAKLAASDPGSASGPARSRLEAPVVPVDITND